MSDFVFSRFPADPDSPLLDPLEEEEEFQTASGTGGNSVSGGGCTIRDVLAGENIMTAWEKVRRNRGAAGADGRGIAEIERAFPLHWEPVARAVENGTWEPRPLRRVELPKANGGVRLLGIPSVLDRVLLQAIAQVMAPSWLPHFSPNSFAYQPGRGALDAIRAARNFFETTGGAAWQVDIQDFFDSVPHLPLLEKLRKHGISSDLLEIVNKSLRSGVLRGLHVEPTPRGIPQGSPLSPLLANIYLDALDHNLHSAGRPFCRYADDLLVFSPSGHSSADTLGLLTRELEEEGLRPHPEKTVLRIASEADFLGYGFWLDSAGGVRLRVAPAALQAALVRLRLLSRPSAAAVLPAARRQVMTTFLRGWCTYFRHTERPGDLENLFAGAREFGLNPEDFFPVTAGSRPRPPGMDYQGRFGGFGESGAGALTAVRCWTGRLLRSGTVRLGMDFSRRGGLIPRPDALRVSILGHTLKFKLHSRR